MVLALQCLSSSVTEVCPPQIDTASFPREPEGRTEFCPDGLKSTDSNLPRLYQIGRLPVKKNHWMTETPGYCDFVLQASHRISQSSPQRCFAGAGSTVSSLGILQGASRDAVLIEPTGSPKTSQVLTLPGIEKAVSSL